MDKTLTDWIKHYDFNATGISQSTCSLKKLIEKSIEKVEKLYDEITARNIKRVTINK